MLKHYKTHFILTLCLVFLLSLASVAQAAPPLQGGDGSSLGDTLNLDDEGNPVDTGGGNNLGTVMSSQDDEDTEDEESDTTDDGTTDDDTTDDSTTDDGTTDDGTTDDDTTDDGTTEEEAQQHPVATALANYFEVEYEEIMTLHEEGNGFGNIAKAYFFADQLGLTPEDLLQEAHGSGWGNVLKENGVHPGAVGNGGGHKPDKFGQADETGETQPDGGFNLTGPGGNGAENGHGNGNGGGNGHGNGGGNGNAGSHGNGGGNGNGGSHGNR